MLHLYKSRTKLGFELNMLCSIFLAVLASQAFVFAEDDDTMALVSTSQYKAFNLFFQRQRLSWVPHWDWRCHKDVKRLETLVICALISTIIHS